MCWFKVMTYLFNGKKPPSSIADRVLIPLGIEMIDDISVDASLTWTVPGPVGHDYNFLDWSEMKEHVLKGDWSSQGFFSWRSYAKFVRSFFGRRLSWNRQMQARDRKIGSSRDNPTVEDLRSDEEALIPIQQYPSHSRISVILSESRSSYICAFQLWLHISLPSLGDSTHRSTGYSVSRPGGDFEAAEHGFATLALRTVSFSTSVPMEGVRQLLSICPVLLTMRGNAISDYTSDNFFRSTAKSQPPISRVRLSMVNSGGAVVPKFLTPYGWQSALRITDRNEGVHLVATVVQMVALIHKDGLSVTSLLSSPLRKLTEPIEVDFADNKTRSIKWCVEITQCEYKASRVSGQGEYKVGVCISEPQQWLYEPILWL